jgi:Carboxypeptidase regulatory-like domain
LTAGEVTDELVLELRVGGILTGEVMDNEGEPAVGRTVIVQRMPDYNRQYMMSSDGNGAFRFEHLEPAQWQVIAMPNVMTGELDEDGGVGGMLGSMEMATADIVDGETLHIILGKPPEDPVKLVGEVRHSGEPVAQAVVSLVPEGAAGLGDLKMAYTDDEGNFEVDLDKRGDYLVTVQNNVGTGRQNSIEFGERIPAEGETHRLRLDLPLGRISGRVKGADGRPAENCRITLNVEGGVAYGSFLGGHYAELVTDAEGNFDIPFLRPGVYTISAGGSMLGGLLGDGDGLTGRAIESGLQVSDGQWLTGVDFKLGSPGQLVGYVKDSAGLPVEGAAVWVRDEQGRVLERFAMVETDGAGKFTYGGLGEGTYSIFAKKDGLVSQPSAPTRLAEGGRAEATVTIDTGSMLLVTVVDKTEAEVRARISVLDGDGNEMSGLLSLREIMAQFGDGFSAKVQRVGPLPPGKYRVSASLDDGRKAYKNVNLGGRAERKIKLRLK